MDNSEQRINKLIFRLRGNGLRITPQRLSIIKIILGNKNHLSVDEIFEKVKRNFPMIGLATVYKTISLLKEMGEISEINFHNQGARYDGSGEPPHPHVICSMCNTVEDLDNLTDIGGTYIDKFTKKINDRTRYQINTYRMDFFGICPKCQIENNQ
jgi:Fur family peroxide stress response transcriptional regulator